MTQILITKPTFINGEPVDKNSKIDVSDELASALIGANKARLYIDEHQYDEVTEIEIATITPTETPEKPVTNRRKRVHKPSNEDNKNSSTD